MEQFVKELLDEAINGLKKGTFKFIKDTYATTGNTYLELGDFENNEPWTVITVNVLPLEDEFICVDTNNSPTAKHILKRLKIAEDTGRTLSSGYCVYPIYKLNNDKLEKYLYKEVA